VRVEKVRVQKRHLKAGRKGMRSGGVVEQEGFVDASSVMLVDPSRHVPGRIRIETQKGKRVRVFAKGGAAVPEPVA
jgi:ribosomal protein L24